MKTLTEDQKQAIINAVDSITESSYEYNTEHKDAADGYSHMIREGDFDYCLGEERLKNWLLENDLEIPKDQAWEILLDWVLDCCEPKPDSIYREHNGVNKPFSVSCFAVGEIETQVDFDEIRNCLDFEIDDSELFEACTELQREFDTCVHVNKDYLLCYQSTDACWNFEVPVETMKTWLEDAIEQANM